MKDVSNRIGIDGTFWDRYSFPLKNETYKIRNLILHKLLLKLFVKTYLRVLPRSTRNFLRKIYYSLNAEKFQSPSAEDRNILTALDKEFAPYNGALAKTLNIDLSIWE